MSRIYSHSALEAFVCEAKGRDAMAVRYGKEGPPRQGQAGHRFMASYMKHLNRTTRDSDMDVARAMWSAIRGQISATDEKALEPAIERVTTGETFPWMVDAADVSDEGQTFLTMDRRIVAPERVHLIDGPVFRVTVDLAWRGPGPLPLPMFDGVDRHMLDWKFHRIVEHVASPDMNRQLKRYCSALIGDAPQMAAWLGFPRHSYYEGTLFSADDLARAWSELVVEPIAQAERLIARPTEAPDRCVGAHCRHCELRRNCDAALRYPFTLPLLESTTASEKATAYALITALRKDYATELRHALDVGETVDDEDITADITESEHLSYGKPDLLRVLGAHVDEAAIDTCARASRTTVDRMLMKNGIKKPVREVLLAELRVDADRKLVTKLDVRTKKKPRAAADDGDEEGSA